MDISIVISTYNRDYNLPDCLSAFDDQIDLDGVDWEVILVDNNSNDATQTVVQALIEKVSYRLRYTFEAKQGLSNARNHGTEIAQGRYIVFTDDDIRVSPGWIAAYWRGFQQTKAQVVGGRIHLDPTVPVPTWIEQNPVVKGFIGFQDYGPEPKALDGHKTYPYGGNMGFERDVLINAGGFDPNLGRKGTGTSASELIKGEETVLFNTLGDQGCMMWYTPDALVYHKVHDFQLKRRYFMIVQYNSGKINAARDPDRYSRTLFGIPLFIVNQLLRLLVSYLIQLVSKGPSGAFVQLMKVAYQIGRMMGYATK
ncbi:MAG: glycosyltransferase family 2 protein [Magnetococcales bacterium]|nr:glycosyltransferase family 2 protein [Magnetococcales bacterium]